jgi:hypothetical protein
MMERRTEEAERRRQASKLRELHGTNTGKQQHDE